jgi:hypothetical protein
MRLSKQDIVYMNRKQALHTRRRAIEDVIIQCIESKNFKQGRDIVDVVMESFPDELPRNVLRMIYNIMHIDLEFLPENYKEDLVLL